MVIKITFSFIFILLLGMVLVGCNSSNENANNAVEEKVISQVKEELTNPHLVGYVTNKDEDEILVVNSEAQDFSATGGVSEYYDAVWVSNITTEVEVGERVEVWFDGVVQQSYPGQGAAKKISVIPSVQPKGSKISEAEAIQKAIQQLTLVDKHAVIIVKGVNYNNESSTWNIEINEDSFQIEG